MDTSLQKSNIINFYIVISYKLEGQCLWSQIALFFNTQYILYVYSNTYLSKSKIGQILSSRIAQMARFFWMLLITNSIPPKVVLTILSVKCLDVMFLEEREH
jgi:hypothetical protein